MDMLLSFGNVALVPGLYNCGAFLKNTLCPYVTHFFLNSLPITTPINQFENGKNNDCVGFFPGLI